ncbi:MAG: DUF1631 family protein [Thermomonas sp.]|uniref:DUF1631 family protein n=1 Tax=Thermomonas sp. TaxID=1971895 RepID=UPI00262C6221|nr:DUF1631 family protein [Thermomonas sp.]MCC7095594.1 DUF1631 family protein [Thermomonas sp.]
MSFRPPTESPGTNAATASLFDALQKLVLDRITPALDATLGDVDDYLFDLSQKGDEDMGLTTLREMRLSRANLVQGFRNRVATRFTAMATRRVLAAGGGVAADSGLSLLSDQDLEQQLAVEQLAASVLRAHGSGFEVAAQRMRVVAANPAMQRREDPLDPVFLASVLGNTMGELNLSDNLRIVVFKFFERELDSTLGEFYERCNALMAIAGILPELRASAATAQPRRAPAPPLQQQPQPQPPVMDPAQAGAFQPQMGIPQPMGGGAAPAPMQISVADQAMFAGMLGQLQGWRMAMGLSQGTPGVGQPQGPTLGTNDLMSILSLMQHDAAPILPERGHGEGDAGASIAGQLRKQMGQRARKLGVSGDNVNLDGLDGDAVDLVALLFDVLLDGPQYDTRIRQKIGRMLVPCVKAAIKDRRMFLMKEHPARKLLNTVAEACEGNRGEEPQERELLDHVDHTIERLVAEFNEDVAIFETLEQELRSYMAQHRKRFELVERRTTEAQWGRERLDNARESASRELESHRAGRELPPVIADFLARHAAHHLIQVELRDGSDSVRYDRALGAIDGLLAGLDRAQSGKWPDPACPLPDAGLKEILSSAGFTEVSAQGALEALNEALARLAAGQAVPEVDARIAVQAIPVEAVKAPPKLEVVANNEHLDFDVDVHERVKALKVGDWLQLASSEQQFAPAKVSWISPISSRLLLVNRRGIRVLVASTQELAAMVALDKVRLREGNTAFDDAMHQMVNRLQSANAER